MQDQELIKTQNGLIEALKSEVESLRTQVRVLQEIVVIQKQLLKTYKDERPFGDLFHAWP